MIHAILLAAGLSRRMGTQKLLLPYAGGTVIGHIAGQIARSGVDRIVAVTRPGASGIAKALSGVRLEIVTNPEADGDMLSSVRCGLRALPDEGEGFLVALGDQPGITAELIDRMIAAFGATGRGIVLPTHEHHRGHPILFAARYRREVVTRFDGRGLRGLPTEHDGDVLELPESGPAVLSDMDYPEDYRRALADSGAGAIQPENASQGRPTSGPQAAV